MAINGLPFHHSVGYFDGLTSSTAMAVSGIKSGDNLLAVLSWPDAGGSVRGDDKTDFTVADGELTAATIDLSGRQCCAIWSADPAS